MSKDWIQTMSMRWITVNICLLILLFFFVQGCTTTSFKTVASTDLSKIEKVAVLPFSDISGRRNAGKIVTNIFVAELFKDNRFVIEEPGNIVQFMFQERISTLGEIDKENLKILGGRLGVDALVIGTVEEFKDGKGKYAVPIVSITARMVESGSGRVVWSAQNRRRGDDYIIVFDIGEVRSISNLTQRVIKEMIDTIR